MCATVAPMMVRCSQNPAPGAIDTLPDRKCAGLMEARCLYTWLFILCMPKTIGRLSSFARAESTPVNAARTESRNDFASIVTDMTQGARAFSTVGLPLFVLIVSGFYGLSHLVQGKFDVQVGSNSSAQQYWKLTDRQYYTSHTKLVHVAIASLTLRSVAGATTEGCRSSG